MQNQSRGLKIKEKTKDQIEFEEAAKSMKMLTAKLRLNQQGVDTSSISRQELDKIVRLYDEMDIISTDSHNKISEIQRDSNVEIQKINKRTNDKYTKISKDIGDIVSSLKEKHPQEDIQSIEPVNVGTIEVVEEEMTLEERASELADSILAKSKGKLKEEIFEVLKKAQDTTKTVAAFKELTVGKGVPDDIIKNVETIENIKISAQKMAEESADIKPEDKPLDKDIPVITPEMSQKTEEEIAKHKED